MAFRYQPRSVSNRQFIQPDLTEHMIRTQIIDLLNSKGYYAWTNNVGAMKTSHTDKSGITRNHMVRFSKPGFSDIFAVQPKTGRLVCIEVKKPSTRNRTTPWQDEFINLMNEKGALAFVACSMEEVAEKLGIVLL